MVRSSGQFMQFSFGTKICVILFLMLIIKAALVFNEGNTVEEEKDFSGISGEITAAEITEEEKSSFAICHRYETEPVISVLITDSAESRTHQTVQLAGTWDYKIVSSSGTETFQEGKMVDLKDYFQEKQIDFCTVSLISAEYTEAADNTETGICLLSVRKGSVSPVYQGSLRIFQDAEKQDFYVVNELDLEDYLPGVVSSEMPDSFGMEALKAQAVCARSYALSVLETEQPETDEKGKISWDLVDTTDDQVYLSGEVDARAEKACMETAGQILIQDNAPLKPHYYSTSWGQKADGNVFCGEDNQILEAAAVLEPGSNVRKMNEEFINTYKTLSEGSSDNCPVYDQKSPWYRWTCGILLSDIFDKKISEITVTERGIGGYAAAMMITFADGTAEQIKGAKSVRRRLGFSENVYQLQDGSTRSGLSILPSAFFYTDPVKTSDNVQTITIHGGGFGHGFGMSQYGAAEMADEGMLYTDILTYYYERAELVEYYGERGK